MPEKEFSFWMRLCFYLTNNSTFLLLGEKVQKSLAERLFGILDEERKNIAGEAGSVQMDEPGPGTLAYWHRLSGKSMVCRLFRQKNAANVLIGTDVNAQQQGRSEVEPELLLSIRDFQLCML